MPFAVRTADLEQVSKVVFENDGEAEIDWLIAIIAHTEPLIGGVAPNKYGTKNMDPILFHHEALAVDQVRIGQIDKKGGVVVAQIRAEQKRRLVVEQQFEPRQISSVLVE